MRQKRRLIFGEADGTVRYAHVVTRSAGQEILFGDLEKEVFHKILFKQLKFSGCGRWPGV